MSGAERYARWVLDPVNAVRNGRLVKLAAQRFIDDLTRTDIYFDEVEAVKMTSFGENHCYQWEGEWRGVLVQWQDWQRFIYEQFYGWFRKDDGLRRFDEAYVQVSKKNGKSTMCAVDMNFHVIADDRVNTPKVYTAANNEDQAKICVNMAGKIIEQSPDLMDLVDEGIIRLRKYGINITDIIHDGKDGFIKALSKETSDKTSKTSGGKHGINASKGIVDEFGMSPDHGASKEIKTSMASRAEGSMFKITTAGFNMLGPCYTEDRDIGIKVLEGLIKKDNFLVMIFEIDKPVDSEGNEQPITVEWLLEHEEVWGQSNPNIDVSVKRKFLRSQLEDAKLKGGSTAVDVITLNFNVWVNSPEVFIPTEIFAANAHGTDIESLKGQRCFGGLEIGKSGEISALALLFPGELVKFEMLFFMSGEALKNNEAYEKNKDFISVDPGNEVEITTAVQWIVDKIQKYDLHSFAFPNDKRNNPIVQGVVKSGYEGNPLAHGVVSLGDATDEWEKLLRAKKIEHFGNPILILQNANCVAERKHAGTVLSKHGVQGISACIDAIAQWKSIEATEGDQTLDILYL